MNRWLTCGITWLGCRIRGIGGVCGTRLGRCWRWLRRRCWLVRGPSLRLGIWIPDAPQRVLAMLNARFDPRHDRYLAPEESTVRRLT